MRNPSWFSRRYPDLNDLEGFAWEMRTVVMRGHCESAGIVYVAAPGFNVICLPDSLGPLEGMWQLAHEIAHLVLHEGYSGPWAHDRQEHAAEAWAARALIPESAVRRHKNASEDAFVAALSAHYEDLPPTNCRAREVAGIIARIRLSLVEDRQDNNEEAV